MVTRLNVAVAECDLVEGNIYKSKYTYTEKNIYWFFWRLCDINNEVNSNL